jgi:hypothetical protein
VKGLGGRVRHLTKDTQLRPFALGYDVARKPIHGRQIWVSTQVLRESGIFTITILLIDDFVIWSKFSFKKQQQNFNSFIETVAKILGPQAGIRRVFRIKIDRVLIVEFFDDGTSFS